MQESGWNWKELDCQVTLKYTKPERVWTMGVVMRLQEEEDGCWGGGKGPVGQERGKGATEIWEAWRRREGVEEVGERNNRTNFV